MLIAYSFILYALVSCSQASSLPRDGSPSPHHDSHRQQVLATGGPTNRHARGFAALGDSYSAGIGTGLDDSGLPAEGGCRRGAHAYPELIRRDLDSATGLNTTSQWLSCAGATTVDILSAGGDPGGAPHPGQVDLLDPSRPLGFVTLSVGGNDLGFFDVINACIFRFYAFYSGTCEAALDAADAAVRSPVLEQRLAAALREILDAVAWETRPRFSVAVTGYAHFFDAETAACDAMSLGVWRSGPRLSRAIRRRVNALVGAANASLRRAVEEVAGRFRGPRPRVVFVDYDGLFEGHRFCEAGVVEPAYNRTDSWFFLVGGPDNARNGTGGAPELTSNQSDEVLSPLSPLVDPEACLGRAQESRDWGKLALCYMVMAKHRDPSLRPAYDGATAQNGMWWVPTSYGKTFHPRTLGHEAIRDRIYQVWEEHGL